MDRSGEGMDGVKLELVDAVFKRLVQRRVTNAEGKYQFVVPEGRYVIRIASLGREMVKGIKGSYQGEEIVVEGEKPKLVALKIVAKKPEVSS